MPGSEQYTPRASNVLLASNLEISQVSVVRNKRTQTLFVQKICPLLAKKDAQRYYIFSKYTSFFGKNLAVWEKYCIFAEHDKPLDYGNHQILQKPLVKS